MLQNTTAESTNNIFSIIILILFAIGLIKYHFNNLKINNKSEIDISIKYLNNKITEKTKEYKIKQSIYDKFHKNNTDELVLTELAKDILKHCHLIPASLYIKINKSDISNNHAGMYKIQGNTSTIEINYRPGIKEEEIIAILIHECMHFFLRCRNLGFSDDQHNEILTDTAAIYMGYYKYLKAGYGRVGYLNINEIEYIKNKLQNGLI